MEQAAFKPETDLERAELADNRAAHRYSLLIRPAKLCSAQGEFICILRDVSRTGASARLFHHLPASDTFTLELPSGHAYEMSPVWEREGEAGFAFTGAIDVGHLISEASEYPKRGLRLDLSFPVTIATLSGVHTAYVENISQQGARIECGGLLAIDQQVQIASKALRETRAKVRWRSGESYGLVFDDTFSLRDFAQFVARLQCPALID